MASNQVQTTRVKPRGHQVPFFVSLFNPAVKVLLHFGVPMGPMTLLTVRGRNTGKQRTTPVALIDQDGKRYLASVYGAVNWVRNLRARREALLSHGRHSEVITAVELTLQEAAPILKNALSNAPSFLQRYFNATPTSTLEEFEHEARRHPVFQVNKAENANTRE